MEGDSLSQKIIGSNPTEVNYTLSAIGAGQSRNATPSALPVR